MAQLRLLRVLRAFIESGTPYFTASLPTVWKPCSSSQPSGALRSSRIISAREQPTPITKKPAATIMTKVEHDLRHYQSFPDLNRRLRAFQSGNLLGKSHAQTNAREQVKSFRRVARLCFYQSNPFTFWTVLSVPEHPIHAYQIYDSWCGPCFPRARTDSFDAGAPTGTLVLRR